MNSFINTSLTQFEPTQSQFNQLQTQYTNLISLYNNYKQKSLHQYTQLSSQIQKQRLTHKNFLIKLEKKYQLLIEEQRVKTRKAKEKFQNQRNRQNQDLRNIIQNKNQLINNLAQIIQQGEREKTSIVDQHTENLINIVKSDDNQHDTNKYSHTQLLKMYQYVLEQNNCLKKQMIKLSLLNQNKPSKKIITQNDIFHTDKSEINLQKSVQKNKRIKQRKKTNGQESFVLSYSSHTQNPNKTIDKAKIRKQQQQHSKNLSVHLNTSIGAKQVKKKHQVKSNLKKIK